MDFKNDKHVLKNILVIPKTYTMFKKVKQKKIGKKQENQREKEKDKPKKPMQNYGTW